MYSTGNSSPSRGLANILEEVGQYQDKEEEDSHADRTFKGADSSPSPTREKLSYSAVFSTSPAVP